MNIKKLTLLALTALLFTPQARAQQDTDKPNIIYGQPRRMPIGGISVEGVDNYEDYLLIGISGLSVGEEVTVPGDEITAAVNATGSTACSAAHASKPRKSRTTASISRLCWPPVHASPASTSTV